MPLAALGPRTESWFVDEVVPLDDVPGLGAAVALRTPSDPSFRWGNLLVLDEPIAAGALPRWEARFEDAFADLPGVRHRTLAWTGADGALAELAAAGYDVDRNTVRVASAGDLADPGPPPEGFALAPVRGEADWRLALHLEANPYEDPEAYRLHMERRAATYRRLAAGAMPGLRGGWYLATLDGEPAGSMGVFVRDGLARFQAVYVVERHRGRGVATAMVHAVARAAFARWDARQAAIMVDDGTQAERIYARIGFRDVVERYVGGCRKESVDRGGT
jgi:GNAT superfamily N-acetyltransferase